jgi:putative transposase
MPRTARQAPGGLVYHIFNRAGGRLRLFREEADFLAFEQVLREAHERVPIRILDWCIMSNHWHLVLWPQSDGQLTLFMRWLTLTHTQRWKHAHNAVGDGHLYQGRFKSFPIQQDEHLLTVLRYVARSPLRARLVPRVEQWRWGGSFVRFKRGHALRPLLAKWPMNRPHGWLKWVNRAQTVDEEAAVQEHINRGRPFGAAGWTQRMARRLGIEHSLRARGRPVGWRKQKQTEEKGGSVKRA